MLQSKEIKTMVLNLISESLPPWVSGYDFGSLMPARPIKDKNSGKWLIEPYTGKYNKLIGYCVADKLGGGNLFATFNQWLAASKKAGYKGRIMEKGTGFTNLFVQPLFLKPVEDTPENRVKYPKFTINKDGTIDPNVLYAWRDFKVFHESVMTRECVEAVKDYFIPTVEKSDEIETETITNIDKYVSNLSPVIKTGKPSYAPSSDTIYMPELSVFKSHVKYYENLIHEIGHWTGHSTRLDRTDGMACLKGSHKYSYEELIAEWFCCLKFNDFGLIREPKDAEQHAAYLKGWQKHHPDSEAILNAFFDAQSAVKYADKIKKKDSEYPCSDLFRELVSV